LQIGDVGLYASVQDTKLEFEQKLGFPIYLEYQLPPQLISSHQTIHLVQITREALNNIFKHAQASQVWLKVAAKEGKIVLTISDNGIGFYSEETFNGHYGLMIMRDRAESLGGQVEVTSQLNQGTMIKVSFKPQ